METDKWIGTPTHGHEETKNSSFHLLCNMEWRLKRFQFT